jgi:hypothetical protein
MLQHLTVEFVTTDPLTETNTSCESAAISLSRLAKLTNLESLRLRGLNGITLRHEGLSDNHELRDPANVLSTQQLDAFSSSNPANGLSMQQLGSLQHLHTLSLTSVRLVSGQELAFIASLLRLRVLELGDCHNWTAQTFGELAKLSGLQTLRLECGGEQPDLGLGPALCQLSNLHQLELIKFVIADDLVPSLKQLRQLKTFSVWPELSGTEQQRARVNTLTLDVVSSMSFLSRLDWGILVDSRSLGDIKNSQQTNVPFINEATSDSSIKHVSINELVTTLGACLPQTKIHVFRVPVICSLKQ